MKLTRAIAATVAVGLLSLGVVAGTAPSASAKDSSWGCGGYCRTAP